MPDNFRPSLRSTARIAGHPIHPMLVPFPIACFVGVFLTDLVYWRTADMLWADFSTWLVTVGLIMACLAAIAGLVDFLSSRSIRLQPPAWPHAIGNVVVLILATLNMLVHTRDAWTSVFPWGLTLSTVVVLILLFTGWMGWSMVDRYGVGVGQMRIAIPTLKRTALVLACGSMLALAACDDNDSFDVASQIGPNPSLPELKQYLFPPMRLAPVVGWKAGEKPTVANGLKIEALATGLQHPRSLYVLPNGDILVVESKSPGTDPVHRPKDIVMRAVEAWVTSGGDTGASNRITLLRDSNGDGKPAAQSVFLDHLTSPFGVALVGSDLYVANTDAIMRYPYNTGDAKITSPGTQLTALPGGPIDHHWTKSLVASPDGSLLYVGVGSNSNITENGLQAEENRAAIWEVDRASGRWRIFASGLRNPNGLTWEPQSGALWAVINERDELGPDLVPDYMTSVKDGGFYGWPYSYFGQHIDPRVEPQRPDLVEKAIVPDYSLSSHVAPLGLAFYTADSLPQKYRGGAFVGEHGSWDRPQFNGYKVVFVPFSGGGRPSGKAEDVVTDFLNSDQKARGRPVGLAVDKSGALLIADDVGNTVWRVTAGQ